MSPVLFKMVYAGWIWAVLHLVILQQIASVLGCWWQFEPGMTWQWQLTSPLDLTYEVEMYDVDLYDTYKPQFDYLKKSHILVVCYISVGTWENWRPDAHSFPNSTLGKPLSKWPGERWLDIRSPDVKRIISQRIELARRRGCDGIEPDNIDAYENDNGLGLTANDQLQYNIWLSVEAHSRNLSIGLKNDPNQAAKLEKYFDWALTESCMKYKECDLFKPFIQNNKAVFHVEYVRNRSRGKRVKQTVCKRITKGFSTLIKLRRLNAWRLSCDS
ncbi:uncharacterized protein LOC106879613 isoform X2 [Octopus bimaculoides]|uniref:uncharacterized protein LOC106879613 isoform X2 n=1 Tax=Octopus bimaculoides TaxID=37653 RepID=UPI00071CD159|nr:uncharacterized protein LOC106879613 isoform X2 [Octopus bimaculoides]|eukprot:XP_014784752.1 PREDICTED: uncharacterized protein LOC106879613 isoform X3 [Octopus bimaculoides]